MTHYTLSDRVAPIQDVQPQFPQFTDLNFIKDEYHGGLKFNPLVIPSKLKEVMLEVGLGELKLFRELGIRSIDKLTLFLNVNAQLDMEELYRLSSWFLGYTNNFRNHTLFNLKGKYELMDMEQIRWTNATKLQLDCIDASLLMELFIRLPLLSLWT